MTRRTGNNYSGPRWAFSPGNRPANEPRDSAPSGVSISGGSNRETEVHRPWARDVRPCEECGDPTNGWHKDGRGAKRFCCGEGVCCMGHTFSVDDR